MERSAVWVDQVEGWKGNLCMKFEEKDKLGIVVATGERWRLKLSEKRRLVQGPMFTT